MSKKNEILLSIALDGDSEVKRKIKDVGETGKRSLDNIGKNLGNANTFRGLRDTVGGLGEALAPLTEAGGLAGLLGGAGIGGLLSRLATGPAGIASAITAALVGLAKIGEGSDRAKGRLSALGDDKGFDKLTERAKALGTDVGSLQPRYEKFIALQEKINGGNPAIIHPPGFQPGEAQENAAGVRVLGGGAQISAPSRENFGKFDSALLAQIRRDVKSSDEARQIADQFQASLAQDGLTADNLRSLPPHAANLVTQQLSKPLAQGFANPNDLATAIDQGRIPKSQLSATEVINAGAQPNPEADKAAESARGLTQSFEALQAAVGRFIEKLGGDHLGVGKTLDSVAKSVDQISPEDFVRRTAGQGADTLGEVLHGKSGETEGDLPGRALDYGIKKLSDILPEAGRFLRDGPKGVLQKTPADAASAAAEQLKSYFGRETPLPARPTYAPKAAEEAQAAQAQSTAAPLPDETQDRRRVYTDGRRFSRTLNPTEPPAQPVPEGFVREEGGFIIKQAPGATLPPQQPALPPVAPQAAPSTVPPGFEIEPGGFLIKKQGPTVTPPLPAPSLPQSPPPQDYDRVGALQQPPQPQQFASLQVDLNPVIGDIGDAGRALASAIHEAAHNIRNSAGVGPAPLSSASGASPDTAQQQFAGGGAVRNLDDGGHIRGAGTTTSDSIPAMLSDGEYVVKASSARKAGRGFLDWLNAGKFADGGAAVTGLGAGSYDISPTDDGGAIINGVEHRPGDPILNDPIVKQALSRARAAKQDDKPRHHSDFTGTFGGHQFDTAGGYAKGGAVGNPARIARIASAFGNGGIIDVPAHFALGGLVDAAADATGAGPAPSLDKLAPAGGGSMGHYDVDLRTNAGDFRMMAPEDVARKMSAAARNSANVRTGKSPSWDRG